MKQIGVQANNNWVILFAFEVINMLDWNLLFAEGLLYGLGLSLILTLILVIVGSIVLDMFVDDYPPAIRQKYGPMSPRAARLRPYFAPLLFIPLIVVPVLGLFRLQTADASVGFWSAFVFSGIILLVFNLFDLFILDWLFFCTIQPRAMVLPGTEGMVAYRDYRFHFIGFLKGLGFTLVGSLIVAVLWIVIQWLIL
jgi:hypothetical protein